VALWLDLSCILAGGFDVVLATAIARRGNGVAGGLAAAAPITPTFALLPPANGYPT
jgi:hypothetical protein